MAWSGAPKSSLVGRRWEMAALDAMVDRAIGGRGGVVEVVGPPGIGKSRVARETAALAAGRGVEVFWTFCESHARDIPFYAVARLLRAGSGVADLDGDSRPRAVAGSRSRMPTRRICCCSMICWASPTPMWRCPRSTRMRGGAG